MLGRLSVGRRVSRASVKRIARRVRAGLRRRWLRWTRYRLPTPQRVCVYKTCGETKLRLFIFEPKGRRGVLPVVMLFHGGGWKNGAAADMFPECRRLASLGIVGISVQYRLLETDGTTPFECVADAKDAYRWILKHVEELQIDPKRMVAGGTSAGGHQAISLCLFDEIDEAVGEEAVRCEPKGLILWNPVLDSTMTGYVDGAQRLGACATQISPVHRLRGGLPPCLILHGTNDVCTPYENSVRFTKLSQELGNPCELVSYEGRTHGFHHHTSSRGYVEDNRDFEDCMERIEDFLAPLGFLT